MAATPSMGGARPKATVQDQERYWLVKPVLPSDAIDIPLLEFAVQRWATASGMCFAHAEHHLDQLIKRVQSHASVAFEFLPPELRGFMTERLAHGVGLLL